MTNQDPEFIECAMNAYERGVNIDAIEMECGCTRSPLTGAAHSAPPQSLQTKEK